MSNEPAHVPLRQYRRFTDEMLARVIGQEASVREVMDSLIPLAAGIREERKPAAAFLFLGPTGIGKTLFCQSLAELLHGSKGKIIRIDCAEYQHSHEVAKLIGSPPGYLGHNETKPVLSQDKLANATSEYCAHSIILFDEVEKAHPAVAQLLLGILDNAQLRLGTNTIVDFSNTLIFFTSNLGGAQIQDALSDDRLGYKTPVAQKEPDFEILNRIAQKAVAKHFAAEFINRLDGIIMFRPLDDDALGKIFDIEMGRIADTIMTLPEALIQSVNCTPNAKRALIAAGTSAKFGARYLKRTLNSKVVRPVAKEILDTPPDLAGVPREVLVAADGENDVRVTISTKLENLLGAA